MIHLNTVIAREKQLPSPTISVVRQYPQQGGGAGFVLPERGGNLNSPDRLFYLGHRLGFIGLINQAKQLGVKSGEGRLAPTAVAAAVTSVAR